MLNDFNIEANGRVFMLSSGLNVSNALNLQGLFEQDGGELVFTNSFATTMQIEGGRFNLTNGYVFGRNMYLGGTNDGYVNASGLVSLDWLVLGSKPGVPGSRAPDTYVLQSGWLIVGAHELVGQTGFGTLTQNGGTNSASDLAVGNGIYVKNGGGLFAGEVRVISPSGTLTHAGGTATITNVLRLAGQSGQDIATFNMHGGSLSSPRVQLESAAVFTQTNGTVNVATELFVDNGPGIPGPSSRTLFPAEIFSPPTPQSLPRPSRVSTKAAARTLSRISSGFSSRPSIG